MRWTPLLALAAVAAPAVAADQFDLNCSGAAQGMAAPQLYRYHVDLAAKLWCSHAQSEAGCSSVGPIAEVDPTVIWFKRDQQQFPGGNKWIEYVNRTDGRWYLNIDNTLVTEGTCEVAPFTGMHAPATKF